MPIKAAEFIKRLLEMNERFNKISVDKVQLLVKFERKPINWFIALMFAKAIKTHSALTLLCRQGYGEDAFVLARSLFEIVLDVTYILKEDTEKRLCRYLDFYWKASSSRIGEFSKNLPSETSGELIFDRESIEKIYDKAAQVQEKHKYDRTENWLNKKDWEMAEELGMKDDYDTIYKIMCGFAHTDISALLMFTDLDNKENPTISFLPSNKHVKEVLLFGFEFIFKIVTYWSELLAIPMKQELCLFKGDYEELSQLYNSQVS